MTRDREYDALPDKTLRFECRDKEVRYVEFQCGEYGSFTFAFPMGAFFVQRTGTRNTEFRFHDVESDVPSWDAIVPVMESHPDRKTPGRDTDALGEERRPFTENPPLPHELHSVSMSAVSMLLAALATTIREYDESNTDIAATSWILETMQQAFPRFVEGDKQLDEDGRDEALYLFATFFQMCFLEDQETSPSPATAR